MSPCQSVTERCFCCFFSPKNVSFLFWGDIWVIRNPRFPTKKKGKNTLRERVDRGSKNSCAKFQDLSLENVVNILTFMRKTRNLRRCLAITSYLQLLSFGVGSAFNVRCTCYWPYAVRSSNIISKVFADMPCNNGHRSEKTGKIWLNRTEARYCC